MIGLSATPESHRTPRHAAQLLYFMIKPHPAPALEIDRLRRSLGLDSSYPLKRFHITLQPFGDIRGIAASELHRIRLAAASLEAEPFRIALSRLRGNALVCANAHGLRDFQRRLVQRLAAFDVFLPDYAFDPHLSLLYGEWQARNIPVPPIAWLVDELLLINSVRGKGHEVIDRWKLLPRQGSLGF